MTYPKPPSTGCFRVIRKRPNGKQYRAFKPPLAIVLDGGSDYLVLVIRCDEYQYALDLARAELNYELQSTNWEPSGPVFGWWRESIRDNESYWVQDEVRGAPGYMFRNIYERP